MKRKIKHGFFFLFLFIILFSGTSTRVYAVEFIADFFQKDYALGKFPVVYYEDGKTKSFQVMVKDENLYVEAQNLAEKLDFLFDVNDDAVQILLDDEWQGRRIANFKMNSTSAWYYDGAEVIEYEMPFASIENEEGYWIPFRFAIKMMGGELVLVGDDVYLSCFHESIENAVGNVSDVYQKSAQLILGLDRFYENSIFDDYSETEKQMMLAELEKKEWLQQVADVWDGKSISGVNYDELTSYLVSNYNPEFLMESKQYLELLNLYVANPMTWNNAATYEENTADMISILAGFSNAWEVAKLFEEAIESLVAQNPEIFYNDAYRRIYSDTIGLDPVAMTWSEENIRMDEWLSQLISYKGLTNNYVDQVVDSTTTILNLPDAVTNGVAVVCNEITIFRNVNAKNGYAANLFDEYLSTHYTVSAEDELYEKLQERIDNYGQYMEEYRETYMEDMFGFDDESLGEEIADGFIEEALGESIGTAWSIGKTILSWHSDMQEAREKDFLEYSGTYSAAKMLSRGLRNDAMRTEKPEWAYLYYKTDAIALNFIYNAIEKTEENFYDSDVEKLMLMSDVNRMIEEESYHMSIIKMGIHYGLQKEDNEAYNKAYSDATYLSFVIEKDRIMGNTNGNMNAGGFVCESENYYVEVSDSFWVDLESRIMDKNTDKEIGDGSICWWLNLYEDDKHLYLYYVRNNGEIVFTDTSTSPWETETIRSGQNKKLMIYDGYLYYQEGGTLYRREMTDGLLTGAEEVVLSDVGECIAYIGDAIYYSNGNAEVCRYRDEEGTVPLGIYSNSFDFIATNMYYANEEDSNTIYVYNYILGTKERVENTPNCYFLNANGKQLYYKVDSYGKQGLVYAFTPYVNISRVVVYAAYNSDNNHDFPSEYYQWNNSGRRMFNVSNGTIYNEAMLRCISPFSASGFSIKNALMHFVYNISEKLSE